MAGVADVGVDADGADDGGGRYSDGGGLLDERLKGQAERGAASGEEPGGVDVAVDRGVVGDAIVLGDLVGAAPAEEVLFDGVAVGMSADIALAGVAGVSTVGTGGSRPEMSQPLGALGLGSCV